MTTEKVKLVRICDGLYRAEPGGAVIGRTWPPQDDRCRWVVRYSDWFGAKVEKRFEKLAEARHFINTGEA
jgi:hypothetical protein